MEGSLENADALRDDIDPTRIVRPESLDTLAELRVEITHLKKLLSVATATFEKKIAEIDRNSKIIGEHVPLDQRESVLQTFAEIAERTKIGVKIAYETRVTQLRKDLAAAETALNKLKN